MGVDQENLIVHRTMREFLDLLLHMGGAPYCLLFFFPKCQGESNPQILANLWTYKLEMFKFS